MSGQKLTLLLLFMLAILGLFGCSGDSTTGVASPQVRRVSSAAAPTAASQEQVQKAYIAYYGRPADPGGLAYWAGRLDDSGGDWGPVIESFGNSSEASALLAGLSSEQKIDKLYSQMFGRSADPEGRAYYANGLSNGSFTLASLAINIINGVSGANADATAVANKLAAARLYTASLNTDAKAAAYSMATVSMVQEWLAAVTATATTQESVDSLVNRIALVTQGSLPTAAFTYTPATPVSSQTVAFTDSSTGSPNSWSWSFGDGTTSSLQNPSHVYVTAGTFTVTLQVSNQAGSNSFSTDVTVGQGIARTVGLMVNNSGKAFPGYTLFAPKQNTMTYLINNEGRVINKWTKSKYPPGQSVYLLENGNLLRACMTQTQLGSGGGEGGRIEEYDWNDNLVWELNFSTSNYMQHHDIKRLPNGNILMLVVEKKTYAEVLAAGFNPSKLNSEVQQKGMMLPDYVVEIEPTKPVGGKVVWEWHVWDHLIQDYDSTKANYGVVKSHPELISTAGDQRNLPIFWNHMNSIDYNPDLDQIALSVRGNSEVWIIDHSTTTEEAKGHTGGKRGKGGDLLYRWGNPSTYGAGTVSTRRYFEQHDVEWVRPGYPGAGNLTCFNNGIGRGNYSSVDEFTPAIDANGNYPIVSGNAFAPSDFTWSYKLAVADYSENISGAQRLPNGNTIICSGAKGLFLEVTPAGETVWRYICPVDQRGPIVQGASPLTDPARTGETMNSVFRVYRYPFDYAAFVGKTLTPGDYVEQY